MADKYVLIDCSNGHTFTGQIIKTEAKELVLQQLICPSCGRRWETFSMTPSISRADDLAAMVTTIQSHPLQCIVLS